jgi:hypothetical protein
MARTDRSPLHRFRPTRVAVVASVVLGLGLLQGPVAEARCFPELDDEVLVFFDSETLAEPFVVGALWNGEEAPPDTKSEVSVLAPRHLAAALMKEVAVEPSKDQTDRSVGSTVRLLAEQTAEEQVQVYAVLERVYEAGFVESAQGGLGDLSREFAEMIEGVYEAEVKASIQQMEAYGELLGEVSAAASDSEEGGKEGLRDEILMMLAADLIDLDLSLRDPDCD